MKIQWYIPEPARHHDSENAAQLVFILKEMGMDVYCNKYVPFGAMDYSFLDKSQPAVLYGHLGIIRDVQKRNIDLRPFVWCDFFNLKCSTYYAFYGKYLVQRNYAFYPLAEIARNVVRLYQRYGRDDCLFIRPDDNMKTFTGKLVPSENFDSWYRHTKDYESGPDCLCVVSSPEPIEREYRLVIKDGRVITGSQYLYKGQLAPDPWYPSEAVLLAEEIAASTPWEPAPIYVMDVAHVDNQGFKLLEIGSVNAAGLYKCNLRSFVEAVNATVADTYVPCSSAVH